MNLNQLFYLTYYTHLVPKMYSQLSVQHSRQSTGGGERLIDDFHGRLQCPFLSDSCEVKDLVAVLTSASYPFVPSRLWVRLLTAQIVVCALCSSSVSDSGAKHYSHIQPRRRKDFFVELLVITTEVKKGGMGGETTLQRLQKFVDIYIYTLPESCRKQKGETEKTIISSYNHFVCFSFQTALRFYRNSSLSTLFWKSLRLH